MPHHVEQKVAPVSHDKDLGKTWVKVNSLEYLVIWIFSLPWMIWNSKSWTFSGASFMYPSRLSWQSLRFEGIEMIQNLDSVFFRTALKVQCVLIGSDNLATKGTFTIHVLWQLFFLASKYPGWMISWSRLDKISNTFWLPPEQQKLIIIDFYRYNIFDIWNYIFL